MNSRSWYKRQKFTISKEEKIQSASALNSALDPDEGCFKDLNEESSDRYQELRRKHNTYTLVHSMNKAWAQTLDNREKTIIVQIYNDDTKHVVFDEGWSLTFNNVNNNGTLLEMDYWSHYSYGTDEFRFFFKNFPGFNPHAEMNFYFQGPCHGHVVFI